MRINVMMKACVNVRTKKISAVKNAKFFKTLSSNKFTCAIFVSILALSIFFFFRQFISEVVSFRDFAFRNFFRLFFFQSSFFQSFNSDSLKPCRPQFSIDKSLEIYFNPYFCLAHIQQLESTCINAFSFISKPRTD